MKTLVPYPEKCTGCRYCELVCSLVKENLINPELARLKVIKKNISTDVPVVCIQCGACIDACPTEAIKKNEEGIVSLDQEKCVGCGACVEVCPFGLITLNEVASKCDLCNNDPQCVKFCTQGALKFEEADKKQFERMRSLIR